MPLPRVPRDATSARAGPATALLRFGRQFDDPALGVELLDDGGHRPSSFFSARFWNRMNSTLTAAITIVSAVAMVAP